MKIPRGRLAALVAVLIAGSLFAALGAKGGGAEGKQVETAHPRTGPLVSTIEAQGTVQAASEVGLGAPFDGRVLQLVKDEGDRVEAGDVVFRLDPKEHQEAVTQAEIDLARKKAAQKEAEADLAEAKRKDTEAKKEPSDLTEARLKLRQSQLQEEQSQAQLESAKAKLDRAQVMLKEGIGREVDVEAAVSEDRVAAIAVKISGESLDLSKQTLHFRSRDWTQAKEDASKNLLVAQTKAVRAKADLEAAKVSLTRARRDLERCSIRTPIAGVVTARTVNQGDLVGRVNPASPQYIVSDLSRLFVYTDVDEGDVVHVARGQQAKVTVNALNGPDGAPSLTGRVYDVGYRANRKAGEEVSTFQVRVLLDPGQADAKRLRPGMTATVEIQTAAAKKALKVPLQALVQRERSELPADLAKRLPKGLRGPLGETHPDALLDVLYVVVNGKCALRVVDLGIQDLSEVQVKAGLEPDAELIVGPHRVLADLKPGEAVVTRPAEDLGLKPEPKGGAAATAAVGSGT